MFKLSAFADEISPEPNEQLAVLKRCRVQCIEFRSIHGINVLNLSDSQLSLWKTMLDGEGFTLSAIGSPVGKVPIDSDFAPHLDLFKHALDVAHRFDCPRMRIFSYRPPTQSSWDGDWAPHRDEVLRRLRFKTELAERAGVTLLHENEHNIYGDSPARAADIFAGVNSMSLRAAYDAANWVFCGYDPIEGWERTKQFTAHLHIKDWLKPKAGDTGPGHGVLAGMGDGQMRYSLSDAVSRGYSGFAVLEPHLRGGGPTGGYTGADLFPVAVEAFRTLLTECGGVEG